MAKAVRPLKPRIGHGPLLEQPLTPRKNRRRNG
jgi:hypothetical protein